MPSEVLRYHHHAECIILACEASDDPALRAWVHSHDYSKLGKVESIRRGLVCEATLHDLLDTRPRWIFGAFDGGYDGLLAYGQTWDSKGVTARPRWLAVPPTLRRRADMYVLCKYHESRDAGEPLGWEYWRCVQRYPIGTLPGEGKRRPSHLVPREDLRPMEDLYRIHREGVERFEMTVEGETWAVSINHRRHAVRVGEVVYSLAQWQLLKSLDPLHARTVQQTCAVMDGEIEGVFRDMAMDGIAGDALVPPEDDLQTKIKRP